jgi:hypothetical protein
MIKAATMNPDDTLLALIERYDAVVMRWNRLSDDDAKTKTLSVETTDLELRILTTPAFTREGLAGKRRVAAAADIEDDSGLLSAIFLLDAERVSP